MTSASLDHDKPEKVTLYDFPAGAYPSRVRIALNEKDMNGYVEHQFIDLFKGDHKTPAFRSTLNHFSKIPVLKFSDGTVLSEAVAITQYLDNIAGCPTLTGKSAFEQGLIQMQTRTVENEFLEPINQYFHTATPGLGPAVESYTNEDWGLHNRERGLNGLNYFNDVLGKQPYIAGNEFSMADIAAIAGVIVLSFVETEIPSHLKALLDWFDRVKQRPSVKKYLDEFHPSTF